ncbi:MAG: ATP-binding cassette domain-containing protein [Chloroflexota bacterium]|nr:ATP-binding cassette domain-containing protein [Chloroflexota bacterium]
MTSAFAEVARLTLRHIGRRAPALRDLSLQWERGERLLLLGPSGSGKSTLALCLDGVIPHAVEAHWESGSVRVDGAETRAAGLASLSSTVGVLFQDPETQLVMLEIDDEIAFGLENHAVVRAQMGERIAAARAQTGLRDVRAPIAALSGGTKQRVALAAILAQRPRGLVLDEPTANLDPVGAREVLDAVERLVADRERSLLIIEHRLDDVLRFIDRVAVLDRDGGLALVGTPRDVFVDQMDRLGPLGVWIPQLRRLAALLGSASLPRDAAEAAAVIADRWPAGARVAAPAGPAGSRVIRASGIAYRYPGRPRPALDGVSLTIARGELLAIVGPNGAGKSTLGLVLAGALVPGAGSVDRLGQVAYVFQYPEHQFVARTVADELRATGRARGLRSEEVDRIVDGLLDRAGLRALAEANPFTLSHGQKRRLSVATALAAEPDVLILDEPTFGQDERNTELLLETLDALRAEGRAIVVITHDLALVADHATRVVALDDGHVAFDGAPAALFDSDELMARCALRRPPVAEAFRIAAGRRPEVPRLIGLAAVRSALG